MKIEIDAKSMEAGLYIVATPIGNLGDITIRALEVLNNVDIIYCEDTRQTLKLLNAYGIKTKVSAYHDHSSEEVRKKIIAHVKEQDKAVAIVSDAGMPLISDPGYKLVQEAYSQEINVTSLPGANAVLTALQLSGLPSESFTFLGFLPTKQQALQKKLEEYQTNPSTIIFYEAKQRIQKTLEMISQIYKDRPVSVARELTKKFEEILRGSATEILDTLSKRESIKGEFVLLIGPYEAQKYTETEITSQIKAYLVTEMPVKKIAEDLSELSGWPKKEIYNLAIRLKDHA